jgi:hypothetical protein
VPRTSADFEAQIEKLEHIVEAEDREAERDARIEAEARTLFADAVVLRRQLQHHIADLLATTEQGDRLARHLDVLAHYKGLPEPFRKKGEWQFVLHCTQLREQLKRWIDTNRGVRE